MGFFDDILDPVVEGIDNALGTNLMGNQNFTTGIQATKRAGDPFGLVSTVDYGQVSEDSLEMANVIDPLGLSGDAAGYQMWQAQQSTGDALTDSINFVYQMYSDARKQYAPYLSAGDLALPMLAESLSSGSDLGSMKSGITGKYAQNYLSKYGFSPSVVQAGSEYAVTPTKYQEQSDVYDRALALMQLGLGGSAATNTAQQGAATTNTSSYLSGLNEQNQTIADLNAANQSNTQSQLNLISDAIKNYYTK